MYSIEYATGDEPTMPKLLHFERKNGKPVNIFDEIGSDYSDFGICLLNDRSGGKIDVIRADRNEVNPIITEIFKEWFKGKFMSLNVVYYSSYMGKPCEKL